ncbi:MAG: hypothetical protein HZB43_11185 [candidate division Zixibacteria bacterium]|nr:hypothetical protein [candidate division Zixibacteria bacterium]
MKIKIAVLTLCGSLTLVPGADAKDSQTRQVLIEARIVELGGIGGFNYSMAKPKGADKTDKFTSINLQSVIGYLVTDNFELEFNPILSIESLKPAATGNTITNTRLGALAGGAFHFARESRIVPYIFAAAGFQTNSFTGASDDAKKVSLILPDVGLGIKPFITDDCAIRMELFVRKTLNAEGIKDFNEVQVGVGAGLTVFIRPTLITGYE